MERPPIHHHRRRLEVQHQIPRLLVLEQDWSLLGNPLLLAEETLLLTMKIRSFWSIFDNAKLKANILLAMQSLKL